MLQTSLPDAEEARLREAFDAGKLAARWARRPPIPHPGSGARHLTGFGLTQGRGRDRTLPCPKVRTTPEPLHAPPAGRVFGRGALCGALRDGCGAGRAGSARLLALMFVLVFLFSFINPPTSWTILTGTYESPARPHEWTPIGDIAPAMVRAVVAAEDANFAATGVST